MNILSIRTFIVLSLILTAGSCAKSNLPSDTSTASIERPTRGPKVTFSLDYEKGKRKTDDKNTVSPCDGKSICLKVKVSVGWEAGIVVSGGMWPATGDPILDASHVRTHITVNDDNTARFLVKKSEVSEEVWNSIFAGGMYELDAAYDFPASILAGSGVAQLTIPAGMHPVTMNQTEAYFDF
ncbi:MAG: hypothetical protein RL660_857 [Bacteroidota bacterium]|jgi:hypothetical protein